MKKNIDYKLWFGAVISLLLIFLLFRGIDFRQLLSAIYTVDVRYLFLSVLITFASFYLRAVRWRYLLVVESDIPVARLYPATVIGYMANNLLPARLGELVRAYLLAKSEGLKAASVLASLVIDRLCDGFSVLLLLLLTIFTVTFPTGLQDASAVLKSGGLIMFLIYAIAMLLLCLLKWQTERTIAFCRFVMKPFPQRFADKLLPQIASFVGGINISLRPLHLAAILVSSVAIWFLCVLSVDLVLLSFNIHLPITAAMFILVLLVFAVMLPASPGFIGTFHFACYKGLMMFGIPDAISAGIAIVMHAASFFPVTAVGLYYLWKSKLSLAVVKSECERV